VWTCRRRRAGGRSCCWRCWRWNAGRIRGEALAARLWPDVLDESARVSLRTALVQLRSAIGSEADRFLDASRDRVALAGPAQVSTDVGELDLQLQAAS
jgi:DNA-binding SARP family transcriptional activator